MGVIAALNPRAASGRPVRVSGSSPDPVRAVGFVQTLRAAHGQALRGPVTVVYPSSNNRAAIFQPADKYRKGISGQA